MKRKYMICVKGKNHEWAFDAWLGPKGLQEMRDDGLEVYEVECTMPAWVVDIGAGRIWWFFSDLFRFRNPFKG